MRPTRAAVSAASSTPSTSRPWCSRRCELGRPVRLVLTLEETFQAVRRAACETRVRTGFDRDGRILFQDIEADYLIGAYTDIADRVVGKGSTRRRGRTTCPAVRILARSRPLAHGAVDRIPRLRQPADQLGRGERRSTRVPGRWASTPSSSGCATSPGGATGSSPSTRPCDGDWAQSVRLAAERAGWGTPLPEGRGRGIALGIKSGPTTGLSYSIVRLLVDGSVVVYAGTSDMGQGARTVLAQIAAQELGAPLDWVTVVMGDTAIVPYDQQTSASRSTVLMGNSVLAACRDIQGKLRAMAARAPRRGRGRRHRRRGRGRAARRPGAHAGRGARAGPRQAGRRAHRSGRDAQGRRARAPARRLARVLRVQLHGDRGGGGRARPATSRSTATSRSATWARRSTRSRSGCRTRAPRSWASAIRSWSSTSSTSGPDPEPRRHRLPDPDQHGPAARAPQRDRGERATGRAPTAPRA